MITKKFLAGLAVAGVVAAGGGSAFTASNTVPNTVAGYGTSNISGATANSIAYGFNTDSSQINSATITFTGDFTSKTVKGGFGTGATTTCTSAFDTVNNVTTSTCSGFTQDVATATTFNVAVG
jgi:hypothetical protein